MIMPQARYNTRSILIVQTAGKLGPTVPLAALISFQRQSHATMNNHLGSSIFPNRLHKILADCEASDHNHIISWLPCGKYFKVHDSKAFSDVIMPKYFRRSHFKSFLRSLSMYKFQRVSKGVRAGAYGHPHFLRERLDLCRYVNRSGIVALDEPQEPILKVPLKPETKLAGSFSGCTIQSFPSDAFGTKKAKCCTHAISTDDPSWNLLNNTPPEILDEIILTFVRNPSSP